MKGTSGEFFRRRTGRRAVLRGAALLGAATGVTTLAGCTGSAPAPPTPTAQFGAPAAPAATQAAAGPQPKRGGAFRIFSTTDPPNLDPHTNVSLTLFLTGPAVAYSKLLKYKADRGTKLGEYIPTGDLAESWEQPDETTFIFKLRGNAKWHNIAPVNG